MKYKILFFTVLLFVSTSGFAQDHSKFTALLNDYVNDGWVNYDDLKKDLRLADYITSLEKVDPDSIRNNDIRLAYWINVYNAFTLKIVAENYPIKSINDLRKGDVKIWDYEFINIAGKKLSLNEVEHEIIRKQFNEPRIHFAVVCAAISCPPLLNEAYEGFKLNQQLNDNSLDFFRDVAKNKFDLKTKAAHISKIIDWYKEDFGKTDADIMQYIAQFAPADVKDSMLNESSKWKIKYMNYDWGLNDITNKPEN